MSQQEETTVPVQDQEEQYSMASDIRSLLTLDGELEQINYIMDYVAPRARIKNIEFFKFAAACSLSQQPNDVMKGFSIIKCLEKSRRYDESVSKPQWHDAFAEWLKKKKLFTAASRHTILRFMWNLPSILSDAYTRHRVQEGWIKTGLMPYKPDVILGHWPFHKHLTAKERTSLKQAVLQLSRIAKRDGHIGEASIEEHLADSIGDSEKIKYRAFGTVHDNERYSSDSSSDDDDNGHAGSRKRRRTQKPLEQRPLNHGRCMWLNHEVFIAKFNAIKDAKEQKAEDLVEKQASAAAKKVQRAQAAEEAAQRKALKLLAAQPKQATSGAAKKGKAKGKGK